MSHKSLRTALIFWLAGVGYSVVYLVKPVEGLGYLVRIAFFHIPVAWVAVLAFLVSAVTAGLFLKTRQMKYDGISGRSAKLGLVFCLLATISGAIFAKYTWGAYWNWDPRQTTIVLLLLIYGAYLTLRSAVADEERCAVVAAVYAILAFVTVPFLVFIIPRVYFSLHPEPVLNSSGLVDMDPLMVYVLLAAVAGCTAVYGLLLASTGNEQAISCGKRLEK